MVNILDKFRKTFNSGNPEVTFVTSTRSALGATLACDNLTGWPTDTPVDFVTYRLSSDGVTPVAGTQIDWIGIVSGSTITNLTRKAGATDTGNAVNDVVEAMPTGTWANDLVTTLLVEHTQAGLHAIGSSSTLTSPKVITSLNDTNSNELFKVTATSSAVNEFTVANAATGNAPTLSATGSDTNIDINLTPKGTGVVKVGGNTLGMGAWMSYTPTWTGSTTNPTIGNGTLSGQYIVIGKTVHFRILIVFGSTSTVGSGTYSYGLPVTAATSTTLVSGSPIGQVFTEDAGVDSSAGQVTFTTTTTCRTWTNVAGSKSSVLTGHNYPYAWGTSDAIRINGTYEAA